jgi:hypothetical protein
MNTPGMYSINWITIAMNHFLNRRTFFVYHNRDDDDDNDDDDDLHHLKQ